MSITTAVRGFFATDEPDEPARIDASPAEALEILANQRRRLTIHAFAEAEGRAIELDDLATAIAAAENDCAPADLDSQQRKRVYVGLYQCHVDQLVDAGVIEPAGDAYGANVYRATPLASALDDIAAEIEARCTDADAATVQPHDFETVRETAGVVEVSER